MQPPCPLRVGIANSLGTPLRSRRPRTADRLDAPLRRPQIAPAKRAAHGNGKNKVGVDRAVRVGANLCGRHKNEVSMSPQPSPAAFSAAPHRIFFWNWGGKLLTFRWSIAGRSTFRHAIPARRRKYLLNLLYMIQIVPGIHAHQVFNRLLSALGMYTEMLPLLGLQ